MGVNVCLRPLPDSVVTAIWTRALLRLSSALTTRLPSQVYPTWYIMVPWAHPSLLPQAAPRSVRLFLLWPAADTQTSVAVVCVHTLRPCDAVQKLPSIEDRGQTDRTTIPTNPTLNLRPWRMTLIFNTQWAIWSLVVVHKHETIKGSKVRRFIS